MTGKLQGWKAKYPQKQAARTSSDRQFRALSTSGIAGAVSNITEAVKKASWPFSEKSTSVGICSTCDQNTSDGLINHAWVAWGRISDVERPESLDDPRARDVSIILKLTQLILPWCTAAFD